MPDLFISYSRKDKDFVRRLDQALRSRGREPWVDWADIRPAEEWMQAIYAAIEGADTFIFMVTPDSVASDVCGREIAHAAAHNKRMVPVVARDVKADTVPEALAKLNYTFFREGDDFEKATDKLISALDTDLNWVHAHTRLLTRAIEWNANGKNNSFVLRGDDLRSAEQWLAQAGTHKERQPTALQTEYIIASKEDETQAAVAAAKKIGEVASRGSVSLARYSKEGGKNAQALAQLAQALRLNPENRAASGLTAAMLTQLSWHVPLTGSMRPHARVNSAQFSPDGQRVVTTLDDRTARLWDAASGKPIGEPMKHEYGVWSAQFSPDGQRVVTASLDKTARLWDAASGKPIGDPMKHEETVWSAQFSPDCQRVVTASLDKTARLWDVPIMTDKDKREDILLLAELAEATGGVTLETVGQAENLKLLAPEEVRASRKKIAAKFLRPPSKMTPLQRFLKWSVSDRRTRTISPFSQVTVSEWLENRIKEGTVEGLRAALQVDPANARITAHLGRRLADYALLQDVDPDEAQRARGEADFLTNRARKLAPNNDEVKKLRDEVVKLLELKTN
jgi:WD40 repeat protein